MTAEEFLYSSELKNYTDEDLRTRIDWDIGNVLSKTHASSFNFKSKDLIDFAEAYHKFKINNI